MRVTIEGIKLPTFKYEFNDKTIFLYNHQIELLNSWDYYRSFIVSTPTGSGKTAAALLPLLKEKQKGIFIYPTNALLRNQVISFCKIIGEWLDKSYYIKSFTGDPFSDLNINLKYQKNHAETYDSADVKIAIVDSSILKIVSGGKLKGEALNEIVRFVPDIILTNPDTLFYLFALRYSRAMESLQDIVPFKNIVIDEFHMYAGVELSNLVYLLKFAEEILGAFSRKVFLSATPSDEILSVLTQFFGELKRIETTSSLEGRDAVKNVEVEIEMYNPFKTSEESDYSIENLILKKLGVILDNLKSIKQKNKDIVPAVIILNSVIQAKRIEKIISETFSGIRVASYRGLMNKDTRNQELSDSLILVGTAAIEVGVDFDCKYLFMEATDSASFIQRFGRVGRHDIGIAHVFVDFFVYKSLESKVTQQMARDNFLDVIRTVYPAKDSYAWYVTTKYGLLTARIFGDAFQKKLQQSKLDKIALQKLRAYVESVIESIRNAIGIEKWEINSLYRRYHKPLIEHYSFRSSLPSVYIFDLEEFEKNRNPIYDSDIAMLLKHAIPLSSATKYLLDNKEKYGESFVSEVLSQFRDDDLRFVKTYKYKFAIGTEIVDIDKFTIEKMGELLINTGGNLLNEIRLNVIRRNSEPYGFSEIFNNFIYIILDKNTIEKSFDWRLQRFMLDDPIFTDKVVVFGNDALLCKAMLEKLVPKSIN